MWPIYIEQGLLLNGLTYLLSEFLSRQQEVLFCSMVLFWCVIKGAVIIADCVKDQSVFFRSGTIAV